MFIKNYQKKSQQIMSILEIEAPFYWEMFTKEMTPDCNLASSHHLEHCPFPSNNQTQ